MHLLQTPDLQRNDFGIQWLGICMPSNGYSAVWKFGRETHVCVWPETRTSTSICLAIALRESKSPVGIHWCPCITPIRIGEWVTVTDIGNIVEFYMPISASNQKVIRHTPRHSLPEQRERPQLQSADIHKSLCRRHSPYTEFVVFSPELGVS